MKNLIIFDNQGATFDRYSILTHDPLTKTWDVYGASENPFDPQGFGQYNFTTGPLTREEAVAKFQHCGKLCALRDMNPNVKNFIKGRMV